MSSESCAPRPGLLFSLRAYAFDHIDIVVVVVFVVVVPRVVVVGTSCIFGDFFPGFQG